MAYIFHQDHLPRLVSVVPGRERTFFVNKELAGIDDLLAGVMRYDKNVASPYHYHEVCEHFYFIMEGHGTVETPDGAADDIAHAIFELGEDQGFLGATDLLHPKEWPAISRVCLFFRGSSRQLCPVASRGHRHNRPDPVPPQ